MTLPSKDMRDTSNDFMGSVANSTESFSTAKEMLVQSALKTLENLRPDLRSITITLPEKSEDWPVLTVTTVSSDGIETLRYLGAWPIILIEELVGTFLKK